MPLHSQKAAVNFLCDAGTYRGSLKVKHIFVESITVTPSKDAFANTH